jgi:hypothetical protein
MARVTKKKGSAGSRGRIKVGKLNEGTKETTAKELKKVRGGSPAPPQQQTLTSTNETVTNLSRSADEAVKNTASNLKV